MKLPPITGKRSTQGPRKQDFPSFLFMKRVKVLHRQGEKCSQPSARVRLPKL